MKDTKGSFLLDAKAQHLSSHLRPKLQLIQNTFRKVHQAIEILDSEEVPVCTIENLKIDETCYASAPKQQKVQNQSEIKQIC